MNSRTHILMLCIMVLAHSCLFVPAIHAHAALDTSSVNTTPMRVEIGAFGGVNYLFSPQTSIGIGARLGISFPFGLYTGLSLPYYMSEFLLALDVPSGIPAVGTLTLQTYEIFPCLELGYNVHLGSSFLLRPYLNSGFSRFGVRNIIAPPDVSISNIRVNSSTTFFYGPGLQMLFAISHQFRIGLDHRMIIRGETGIFGSFLYLSWAL